MQPPRFSGIVRVTNSREEVEEATRLAVEKKSESYTPEALILAIDEVLHNLPLSRAIVLYVQATENPRAEPLLEQQVSWFSVLGALSFSAVSLWCIYFLFSLVEPNSSMWS